MQGLNEDQKRAAAHKRGHAVVLAGPGTGKTSTLITRHAVLSARGVSSENIFVVTFTQKAAEEIKARLGGNGGQKSWVGTFHSNCLRLLKRFGEEIGLPKNFKVLDGSAQQRVLRDLNIDWNADDGDLLEMFSRWKDALVSPAAAIEDAQKKTAPTARRAAEFYAQYQTYITENGHLDFSDLMVKTLELINRSEVVQEYIRETFPFVLVDEFQDVNKIQVELLQAMARCGSNLWAVGDDDQALYGWRGSNVFYTVNFDNYFSPATKYTLKTNYRCDPNILKAAVTLIENNKHRVRKQLVASRPHGNGNAIRVSGFTDEKEEAAWIASRIEHFIGRGAKPSDIGILVRTSSVTAHIQQALEVKKISMSLTGATNFWDTAEVKAVCDLMQAIEDGNQKVGYRYKGGADFISTMHGLPPSRTALPIAQFLASRPPANSNAERVASWADTVETVTSMAITFPSASTFKAHLQSMSTMVSTQASDGVAMTTIHSAKGLEYKHIFIAGVEASLMPHRRSQDLEEERRLFYVALTRTKGAADVTFARSRAGRKQQPSPFLAEINAAGADIVVWNTPKDEKSTQASEPVKPAEKPVPSKAKVAEKRTGMPTVYFRKDGSRTMVPPDE